MLPLQRATLRRFYWSWAIVLAVASDNIHAQAPSQPLGGGVPAGNAQWQARQQEAGYAARPIYPMTQQTKDAAANAAMSLPLPQQPQSSDRGAAAMPQQSATAPHAPAGTTRVATLQDTARWDSARSSSTGATAQWKTNTEIVKEVNSDVDRVEMTVSTSRILTIQGKFSRAQVNNPEVLSVTPLAANELQISALKPGVTQIHLWDDTKRVYSVDVSVYGDVQELQMALEDQYPYSSVRVHRYSNSLVLSGYVDRPDYVSSIVRLSEDYAPKVINNMKVGGVQQILLNVQVMEVSRTKLRAMGFDFANINGDDFIVSSISGLISAAGSQTGTATGGGETIRFGIVDGSNSFFGFLKLLRQNDLMKILAEPKLVTVSGRPASFNVGGEFPVLVPQSLGSVSIEYKKFGTQVDFLPIVLGNGNIRLEVRPRISEIDSTRSVEVQNFTIPALRVREIDTGVEMKAGQTLALAGLVQNRMEAQNKGIPVLADMPWLGAAFRSVEHTNNEIELLILVRPELVQAMDPHEVPPGGPGLNTVDPCDTDLYWRGHLEVPRCSGCTNAGCQDCADRRASVQYHATAASGQHPAASTALGAPAQSNYPDPYAGRQRTGVAPSGRLATPQRPTANPPVYVQSSSTPAGDSPYPATPRPVNLQGQTSPQMPRNRYEPVRPAPQGTSASAPGMIGPLGYDVVK